jgi:prepilin-type N-terminal cleavage/methylation domain-containing protein
MKHCATRLKAGERREASAAASRARAQGGFTLIELLVVIGILALLMAILMPAVNKLMAKADISRARTDVQRIANAWQTYQSEYKRWPVPQSLLLFGGLGGVNVSGAEGSTGMPTIVQVMTNIMYPAASAQEAVNRNMHPIVTNYNPKGIVFMAYDSESVNSNGDMVDPWGRTYFFMFDINGDGKVVRGGTMATTVYSSVIVWSLGPDGVPSSDDINNWE